MNIVRQEVGIETIPERGQTTCLFNEDMLAGVDKESPFSQQAFGLPPFWNGLLLQSRRTHCTLGERWCSAKPNGLGIFMSSCQTTSTRRISQ